MQCDGQRALSIRCSRSIAMTCNELHMSDEQSVAMPVLLLQVCHTAVCDVSHGVCCTCNMPYEVNHEAHFQLIFIGPHAPIQKPTEQSTLRPPPSGRAVTS